MAKPNKTPSPLVTGGLFGPRKTKRSSTSTPPALESAQQLHQAEAITASMHTNINHTLNQEQDFNNATVLFGKSAQQDAPKFGR